MNSNHLLTAVLILCLTGPALSAENPAEKPADTPSDAPPATALGTLAASMQPGELKELQTNGYDRRLLKSWYDWEEDDIKKYGSQKMYNIMHSWANDAKWDPATRQVLYFGGGHYASHKFVTYSADTNEWTLMPVPPWVDPRSDSNDAGQWPRTKAGNRVWPRGHSYDCNAILPGKRLYALSLWSKLRLYDIDKKQWLESAPGFRTNSSGPSEGFPELGGFVAFARQDQLCVYNPDEGTKRDLGPIKFGIHGVMEYNPVHKVLVVGGGDGDPQALFRLDKDGQLNKLKSPPVRIRCTPDAKFMCDPASGAYVVQESVSGRSKQPGRVYAFHPGRDQWQELPGLSFAEGVGVAVNTYGVMMICGKEKVYVYKHKRLWPTEPEGKATR